MSKLVLIIAAILLAGCSPSSEKMSFQGLPDELKDCTFHRVSDGINRITVARCPNSTASTAYRSGKTTRAAVVIDGKEYVEKGTP